MVYKGSCHCGRIAFKVEGTLTEVMSCNCSLCQRKGSLMWFVPRNKVQFLAPDENASSYTFHKHIIKHRFCPVCGVHTHGESTDPKNNRMIAINIRCLEKIDLDSIPVMQCDGRSK